MERARVLVLFQVPHSGSPHCGAEPRITGSSGDPMMTARFITRQGGDDREARHLRGAAVGPSVRARCAGDQRGPLVLRNSTGPGSRRRSSAIASRAASALPVYTGSSSSDVVAAARASARAASGVAWP